MWSPDRRRALLALAAAGLAGACGFRPAYGPEGPARGLLNRVAVAPPEDKASFDLVERLEERLGRPTQRALLLSYRIETSESGQAVTASNATNRYTVDGRISYRLAGAGDDRTVAEGQVAGFTSYSASGTTVATVASRDDAYQRLMRLLADRIVTELIAAMSAGAPAGGPPA